MGNPPTLSQKLRKPRARQQPPIKEPPRPLVDAPLPATCAVRCPVCRGEAVWHEPYSVVQGVVDPASLLRRRAVVIAGPTPGESTVWHFPKVFPPQLSPGWERIYCFYRGKYADFKTVRGVRTCAHCRSIEAAALNWPESAYFRITFKRSQLFAQHRADWSAIREYIAAGNRRELYRTGKAHWAARYLPRAVIAAKSRAAVLAAMDAVR